METNAKMFVIAGALAIAGGYIINGFYLIIEYLKVN